MLSVERKSFFSVDAKRLTKFFRNQYIDTTVQDSNITRVPGCLEHTGMVR